MSDTCQICGKGEEEHRDLVQRGIINHELSRDGQLVPVDRKPKPAARRQEVMVVPGVDVALRSLLIAKGVLSESDFADAGAYGGFPGGNLPDSSPQGAGGGLRTSSGDPVHRRQGSEDPGAGGT